jgi:dihydrofolate reductase
MARLIYSAIMSLDGYIADGDGHFHWAAPDEEVHAFVNDLERPVGTYLYGRRMYETMRYWETAHTVAGPARTSQPRPSRPGWWTNTSCSSYRPSSEEAPGPCPTRSA